MIVGSRGSGRLSHGHGSWLGCRLLFFCLKKRRYWTSRHKFQIGAPHNLEPPSTVDGRTVCTFMGGALKATTSDKIYAYSFTIDTYFSKILGSVCPSQPANGRSVDHAACRPTRDEDTRCMLACMLACLLHCNNCNQANSIELISSRDRMLFAASRLASSLGE